MAQRINTRCFQGSTFQEIQQAINPANHLITPHEETHLRLQTIYPAQYKSSDVIVKIDDKDECQTATEHITTK